MNLKQILDERISATLRDLSGEPDAQAIVNLSKGDKFGDYQANGVMALAKRLKRKPRELGDALAARLELGDMIEKTEVAGPGFINLTVAPAWLSRELTRQLRREARLAGPAAEPQTVVVDYSSPNLAKEMHVGHLRGTIIGDAIVRTLEYLGHKVIRQNHFGDWGTQFGMLITHMLERQNDREIHHELADLEVFYRAAKERFDSDPDFAQRARANVVRLQSGDAECLSLWRQFISVSIAHCQALYDRLGITLSERDVVPESFYNPRLAEIVAELDRQGLLRESEGAQCVFLEEFKNKEGDILPVIVQKTGGGFLYATTDLAAIRYRSEELNADRVLYVVDARQSLHFQQVFAVARQAGFARPDCSLEHVSYGTMMGKDGKPFKTRTGGTVKLIDLCEEAVERAFKLVSDKNPDLPEDERRAIADTVGIAAVKYADLSKNRNSDYVFDWDSMLSFEGNTAPYLLYAYTRIRSIFRRAELDWDASYTIDVQEPAERALAMKLLQFGEVVDAVAADSYPNQLCAYLYDLAGLFMSFYEACPVLKAEGAQRNSRLGLCRLSAEILRQGLDLLGIQTLDRM